MTPDLFTPLSKAPQGIPPDVAQAFLAHALKARQAGETKLGAKAICEVIRWNERIEKGNRDYKINNNWTADLARWAMEREPRLRGAFETRERRA